MKFISFSIRKGSCSSLFVFFNFFGHRFGQFRLVKHLPKTKAFILLPFAQILIVLTFLKLISYLTERLNFIVCKFLKSEEFFLDLFSFLSHRFNLQWLKHFKQVISCDNSFLTTIFCPNIYYLSHSW